MVRGGQGLSRTVLRLLQLEKEGLPMTSLIVPKNLRQLSWNHFKIVPAPLITGFDAHTCGLVSYKSHDGKVLVTLKLIKEQTWVVKGMQSPALLKHEQGHWDVFVLWAEELDRNLKKQAAEDLASIFAATSAKFEAINDQYESETGHSRIASKQKEWDCKLASGKKNHTLDLSAICRAK
jgi:hypothetical protein